MKQITELAVTPTVLTVSPREIVCGAYRLPSSLKTVPLGCPLAESLVTIREVMEEVNPSSLSASDLLYVALHPLAFSCFLLPGAPCPGICFIEDVFATAWPDLMLCVFE